MPRKPAYTRHRADTGSQALVEYLRACGVFYAPLGGAIDAICWKGERVALVDFKSKESAPMTPTQSKLIAQDCPIFFVWNEWSAKRVIEWLKR
jgi:hypothetical protein